MTTAIIGVGNLGGTVARHLVEGKERVVLAAQDKTHAETLADELGPLKSQSLNVVRMFLTWPMRTPVLSCTSPTPSGEMELGAWATNSH